MTQEIEPTIQNHDLLRQILEMKIEKAQKERYPTPDDILNELEA